MDSCLYRQSKTADSTGAVPAPHDLKVIWNSIFISGWTIEKWNQIGKEDGWPWSQTDECRFVEGGKILRWRLKPPDFLAPAPQPRCTFSEDFSETFLRGALALMQSRNCPSCISYWSVINLQCIFIWLAKNQDYQKHLCVSNVCFELLRIAGIGAKDCQTLPVEIFQIFQRLSNIKPPNKGCLRFTDGGIELWDPKIEILTAIRVRQ